MSGAEHRRGQIRVSALSIDGTTRHAYTVCSCGIDLRCSDDERPSVTDMYKQMNTAWLSHRDNPDD